jgi:addiction module HigA family antidote
MKETIHPGLYIREQIIPATMPVKEAAKLLGVGRPALSNLLNGNAALSPEMAARLEKAFGVSQQNLLQLQTEFDQHQQRLWAQTLAVGAYRNRHTIIVRPRKLTTPDLAFWEMSPFRAPELHGFQILGRGIGPNVRGRF